MDREALRRALHVLSPREQVVIGRLYGLADLEAQAIEEVAAYYGVTVERIRQIEAKAIRRISQSDPDGLA